MNSSNANNKRHASQGRSKNQLPDQQQPGLMANYMDDNINLTDYTNANSRKQNMNNTASSNYLLANGIVSTSNSRT